jgi:uncharacterized protein (UPF0332 family)
MIINAWFKKAESHIDVCDICFEIEDYDYIINSCFLAMFSVIKALLISKNVECKTHEGLIFLFKINFVDNGLFDRELFKFYCKTKELNTEFFRLNLDIFNEELAHKVFIKTLIFVDYSYNFYYSL